MSGFSFRVDNSPFSQQQADALNQLLATLTPEQMIWLSGYLAGCAAAAWKAVPLRSRPTCYRRLGSAPKASAVRALPSSAK